MTPPERPEVAALKRTLTILDGEGADESRPRSWRSGVKFAAGVIRSKLAEAALTSEPRAAAPCPISSSITGQRCVLPEGHEPDSKTRFHRYAPQEKT